MRDIIAELNAVHRRVGSGELDGREAHTVTLRRTYDAPIDDVWSALTEPDRLARWFLPVTGDLRAGGTYQTQGNAGGEILRCEPPTLLHLTWVFGPDPDPSEVRVRLTGGSGGATTLELEHIAVDDPQRWATYGPGAVGVGWDLVLLGLTLYFAGESIEESEREAFESSAEARSFMTDSANAWGAAHVASGAAADEAATAARGTIEFYVPPQS